MLAVLFSKQKPATVKWKLRQHQKQQQEQHQQWVLSFQRWLVPTNIRKFWKQLMQQQQSQQQQKPMYLFLKETFLVLLLNVGVRGTG